MANALFEKILSNKKAGLIIKKSKTITRVTASNRHFNMATFTVLEIGLAVMEKKTSSVPFKNTEFGGRRLENTNDVFQYNSW